MHSQSPNLEAHIITNHRQSHFAPAFLFLSRERRRALETLYAVCRTVDDAVDEGRSDAVAYLAAWRNVFTERDAHAVESFGQKALAVRFLEAAERYDIPLNAMVDLIDKGVSVDLKQNRFETPMDTEAYCYGVAGTVGLACLPIFGVPVNEAKNYAVRLGIAIQWTNALRDVGVDAKLGRIYLPLEHLGQFGYTEADVFARRNSPNFQALMQHEYEVALGHYRRADELLPAAWKKTLLPARIMTAIYLRLLKKLKSRQFPVFEQKIRLNLFEKVGAVCSALKNN
jgi:phytoene synthase